uniref:phosphotransferase n=1 Tax=Microbacterium sp. CPCC 204701 TaxID=2493084 RepID=UPI0013E35306
AALPGLSAVDPRWIAEPAIAVRAVGEGLRALHDSLPIEDCPFDWGVPSRIANAADRGERVPDALREPPAIDRLVVCHGDACCPNTLIGDDGRWSGHVDLGGLGTGDRWADIAVASMSTAWNYGEGWEDALIEAYGVEPDRERLSYYRDLWNAT